MLGEAPPLCRGGPSTYWWNGPQTWESEAFGGVSVWVASSAGTSAATFGSTVAASGAGSSADAAPWAAGAVPSA